MWIDISKAWQAAFKEGWKSFRNGSIPIGAAITDENGNIIYTGRNRTSEVTDGNHRIAHAETDCLLKLDTGKYPNVKKYTIYACMEPCPMCMGTIVMSNFIKIRVAAKDGYCGSIHYCEDDGYVKSKNINTVFELGDLQLVQLTMQSYFELKMNNGATNAILDCFAVDCPKAVELAHFFYKNKTLDKYAENDTDFSVVYDLIVTS